MLSRAAKSATTNTFSTRLQEIIPSTENTNEDLMTFLHHTLLNLDNYEHISQEFWRKANRDQTQFAQKFYEKVSIKYVNILH